MSLVLICKSLAILFWGYTKGFQRFCKTSNVFWYVKVCIFWKCIQYTILWDQTQMLNKKYKKCLLFSFANSNSSHYFWFAVVIWAEVQGSSL